MEILQLDHVALHVKDVAKTVAFYRDILGLKQIARPGFDFEGAWLRLGKNQSLHLIGGRDRAVHNSNRGDHFALLVDDIDAWAAHLKQCDISHRGPKKRPDGAYQIFLEDPDGHWVELSTQPR